jgi:hypothetical protein
VKEITIIIENLGKKLVFARYIPIKKALILARDKGLIGKLEVQYLIYKDKDEVLYRAYAVDEENKIVWEIFPPRNLQNLSLKQTIPAEAK